MNIPQLRLIECGLLQPRLLCIMHKEGGQTVGQRMDLGMAGATRTPSRAHTEAAWLA